MSFPGKVVIGKNVHIHEQACVVGNVFIGDDVFIAPFAVLRADEGSPFYIGHSTNVQDHVILHGLQHQFVDINEKKYSIYIGEKCSLAHRVTIHGPTKIGDHTFVKFGATVHASSIGNLCFIDANAYVQNAQIGDRCHIGIGAIVKDVTIPEGSLVADGMIVKDQVTAVHLPKVPSDLFHKDQEFNEEVVNFNCSLPEKYTKK